VVFAVSLLAATSPAAAASRRGPSPFCLLPGGSNGPGSEPETCGYFDYRRCLQAAADIRANCVPNSDFRGGVALEAGNGMELALGMVYLGSAPDLSVRNEIGSSAPVGRSLLAGT
jgi:uncharacterized protein DUF3551